MSDLKFRWEDGPKSVQASQIFPSFFWNSSHPLTFETIRPLLAVIWAKPRENLILISQLGPSVF